MTPAQVAEAQKFAREWKPKPKPGGDVTPKLELHDWFPQRMGVIAQIAPLAESVPSSDEAEVDLGWLETVGTAKVASTNPAYSRAACTAV